MRHKSKKIIALVTILTFLLSILPVNGFAAQYQEQGPEQTSSAVYAEDEILPIEPTLPNVDRNTGKVQNPLQPNINLNMQDYKTEDELRQAIIGDQKWVENFPNGLFNFVGTQFQVNENQEYFEIAVVRQGGTRGQASVDFKAIDISAAYGKDYVIRIGSPLSNEIKKNEAAMPLIETIGDNAAVNISESVYQEQTTSGDVYAAEQIGTPSADVQAAVQAETSSADVPTAEKADTAAESTQSADKVKIASADVTAETVYAPSEVTQAIEKADVLSEDLQAAEEVDTGTAEASNEATSLRRARSIYLGKESDRPGWRAVEQGKVEELKVEYDKFINNVPGMQTTLEFADGEYIKYLYLIPLDDNISESAEQVMFALEGPTGGASRGEFYMGYIDIVDDEKPETPLFSVETPTVTAKDGSASVVIKRTGGLQQYAAITVGTEEGTALSGVDYGPGLKELVFTPGMAEQTVSVDILDNPARETDRQFTIALDRTNHQVDPNAADAAVVIPGAPKMKMQAVTGTTDDKAIKLLAAATVAENTNVEKISNYGFSPAKGQWVITGEDFVKDATITKQLDDAVPHQNGNGLTFDYMIRGQYYPVSQVAYPVNGLGGVDSIKFSYYNSKSYGQFVFRVAAIGDFEMWYYKPYKQIAGITYPPDKDPRQYEISLTDSFRTKVNNIELFSYTGNSNTVRANFNLSGLTLTLKEFDLQCLAPQKISRKKYELKPPGDLSPAGTIEDDPGSFWVETVNSNVGNYQASPADPEQVKVYRSDRVKFNYKYSAANPDGRHAKYTGFEVKVGDSWRYYEGTELILDGDLFNAYGTKGIANATIEARPVFTRQTTEFHIKVNTNKIYMENIGNKSSFDIPFYGSSLYEGDVITGLKAAQFPRNTPELPVWTSYQDWWDEYYFNSPDNSNITVTGPTENNKDDYSVDYTLEGPYNSLHLDFGQTLIVKANPNVYKDSVMTIAQKLDGRTYYNEQNSNFQSLVEELYLKNDLNHTVEADFVYVFDSAFPGRSSLGTPQSATVNIYKSDGTLRKSYNPVNYDTVSESFKFSGTLAEWDSSDFAGVIINGTDGTKSTQTREVIVDFLLNTADAIMLTTPDSQMKAGTIQKPITIDSANPLGNYTMRAITSPGFVAKWKDYSPDFNNNGQTSDPGEIAALQKELAERLNDPSVYEQKNWKNYYNDEVFWGDYFSYTPAYFNKSKVYYNFEKLPTGPSDWSVTAYLNERYHTVLNPDRLSYPIPIKNGEVYIGQKQILDDDGDGVYTDTDPLYTEGNRYQAQVLYKGQTYSFAVMGGASQTVELNTSDLVTPYDFKAVVKDGSKEVDQQLSKAKTSLDIVDKNTTFYYRIKSNAGIVPNDSVIRIYDDKGKLHFEARTGNSDEKSSEFSYAMNTFQNGVKNDYSMTIAGLYVGKDELGQEKILKEFPEVRVGLTFCKPLTAFQAIASFSTPLKPVVRVMNKINNDYDLGMDVQIPTGAQPTKIEPTKDYPYERKVITVEFGYSGEKVKEFVYGVSGAPGSKDNASNIEKNIEGETGSSKTDQQKEAAVKNSVDGAQKEPEKAAKTKKGGGGDFSMTYTVSIFLALDIGQKYVDGLPEDTSTKYLSSLVIMAKATADYRKSNTYMTPIGVPITVTLEAGGSATGIAAFDADHKDPYNAKYALDGEGGATLKPSSYQRYYKLIIQPYVELSAEAGFSGLKVGLSGRADFDFRFARTEALTGDVINTGSGGMRLSAKLKAKMLFVQKKWHIYDSKYIPFWGSTPQSLALTAALNNPYQNYLFETAGTINDADIMPRDYLAERGTWNSGGGDGMLEGVHPGSETVLQQGVFPNPETRLIPIDDTKSLLLFIDDDLTRDEKNRASLWYSILENGSSTPPVALDDDGTWDETPDAFAVEGRILVVWRDADRVFTGTETQQSILEAMNISGKWFDPATGTFGGKFAVTKTVPGGDEFADLNPMISYDPGTKRLMVYYTKTDHDDRWTAGVNISADGEVPIDETPEPLYGDLVNGYNVIAYRYADYDDGLGEFVWNESYAPGEGLDDTQFYGQRFLDLAPLANVMEEENQIVDETITSGTGASAEEITLTHTGTTQTVEAYNGLADPRIVETDLTTYDGKAVFAYIIDFDSDLKTYADQQLYVQIYDYAAQTFSDPIEITNNEVQDAHPRFAQFAGKTYLFWLQNGDIVYTSVSDLLPPDEKLKAVTAPDSGKTFYVIDKTDTSKESHVITAVNHTNQIDDFKIAAKDDTVYVLWEEAGTSYKDGLQPGDEGTEDPANLHKERQIFGAGKVITDTEAYPWSKPVQVTTEPGANYSDLSFIVTGDEQFLTAYARYGQEYDDSAGHFVSTNSRRDLAVRQFTITNDLELGDISINNEYPSPHGYVIAGAFLQNTGLKAFKNPYYQFYVTVNGSVYYETDWLSPAGAQEGGSYIPGGDGISLHGSFTMPEDLNSIAQMMVGFRVKNEAGEILAEKEKEIFIKPDLQIHLLNSELTGKDRARLNLYVINSGNKAFNDKFTISAGDKVLHTGQVELAAGEETDLSPEIGLAGAKFDDLVTAVDGSRFDILNLQLKFGEFETAGHLKREISAQEFNELQKVQSFGIDRNGTSLQNGGAINVTMNEIAALKPQIVRAAGDEPALEPLEVKWTSSDPQIISVLSSGTLVPMSLGSATVTASLQPKSEKMLSHYSSYRIMDTSYELPAGVTKDLSFTVNVIDPDSGSDSAAPAPAASTNGEALGNVTESGSSYSVEMDSTRLDTWLKNTEGNKEIKIEAPADKTQAAVTVNYDDVIKMDAQRANLSISSGFGSLSLSWSDLGETVKVINQQDPGGMQLIVSMTEKDITSLPQYKTITADGAAILSPAVDFSVSLTDGSQMIPVKQFAGYTKRLIPLAAGQTAGPNTTAVSLGPDGRILHQPTKIITSPEGVFAEVMSRQNETFVLVSRTVTFPDMDNFGWAKKTVESMASRMIISGVNAGDKTVFNPGSKATRAEFATMLMRGLGTYSDSKVAFKDVNEQNNSWSRDYIAAAVEAGIISGYPDQTFKSSQTVTREQAMSMLAQAMKTVGVKAEINDTEAGTILADFTDSAKISAWARTQAALCVKEGIFVGSDGQLRPGDTISRAEIAVIIAKLLARSKLVN